ncbi:hypothetical protein JCM11641_002383 [Rhodosporidiobolus odoratus]
MPYIDSSGRLQHSAPPLQRLVHFFYYLWLAVCLFFSTLLNPNAARQMKPSSSLKERERRRRENRGADGRGPGGGGGGEGRLGGLSTGTTVNYNSGGCCGGGIVMQ